MQTASMTVLPQSTAMAQSCPNPFRGAALINYHLAAPGGAVKILIFDAAGRLVRTLVDKEVPPGFYSTLWDGRKENGQELPSGVYLYQMKAPGFVSSKRMVLLR